MKSNSPFRWRHFEPEIILLCVRWYCRYGLSYRDLAEMMSERGLEVHHSTLFRWVQRYAPEINKRLRPHLKMAGPSYRIDETYVKVGKQWKYLYRAVDKEGQTIEFMLSAKRDIAAVKRFFKKVMRADHGRVPFSISVGKHTSYPDTFYASQEEKILPLEVCRARRRTEGAAVRPENPCAAQTGPRESQPRAAVFAVARVGVVTALPARGAGLRRDARRARGLREFDRDDPRGNGDDAVADHHYHGREQLTERRLRRNVAVAHGRQRHHRPVDRDRDAREAVLLAFDDVHQRANDDDEQHDGREEDADLAAARAQGAPQRVRFRRVFGELQDAEDAQQAQYADDDQVLTAGQQHAQVGRDDGEQIDDAEEARRVAKRPPHAHEPQQVFGGEEQREQPFE